MPCKRAWLNSYQPQGAAATIESVLTSAQLFKQILLRLGKLTLEVHRRTFLGLRKSDLELAKSPGQGWKWSMHLQGEGLNRCIYFSLDPQDI